MAQEQAGVGRIERGNLHHEVATALRDMIIQDELPPGARIQEAELCLRFGISRTPLREAIRILESEGLVTLQPRRGAVVATPTPDEIKGIFYALGALESFCAPLACASFTDADVAFIESEHAAMLEHHGRRDLRGYYLANQAIHRRIVEGAGNAFMSDLHRSLSIRIVRDRYFMPIPKNAWSRALEEHGEILRLVRERDGAKLAEVMRQHILGSWEDFAASYRDA